MNPKALKEQLRICVKAIKDKPTMISNPSLIAVDGDSPEVAEVFLSQKRGFVEHIDDFLVKIDAHVIGHCVINFLSVEGGVRHPGISGIARTVGKLFPNVAVSGYEENILIWEKVPVWRTTKLRGCSITLLIRIAASAGRTGFPSHKIIRISNLQPLLFRENSEAY